MITGSLYGSWVAVPSQRLSVLIFFTSKEITMTWNQPLRVLLVTTLVAACASAKVGYDYDPGANFSAYRTYEWIADKQEATGDKRIDNSLVDTRIRAAVAAQLRSKGYTTPVNGRPDFYVAYHAGVKDMMKGSSTQHYIGDLAHGTHTTISDVQPYKEGALLVDIVDATSKQLVWRGYAQAEVDPVLTPKERDERISHIVGEMFSHFPPK